MEGLQERINKIFQSRMLFEKEILNVNSDKDRAEIIKILAVVFVRDVLKEHLNFLYIHKLSDFTLKQIANILFKEIANEWIDYAMHELKLSKEMALAELKQENRVSFIRTISSEYYKHYKKYIFEEIVDTFIELLVLNADMDKRSVFINAVINSDFFANRSILNINSSDQLCKYAKAAKDLHDEEVQYLRMKVSEIQEGILNPDLNMTKREDLNIILPTYDQKLKETLELKLEHYDSNLKRVKMALMASLKIKDT